MREELNTRLFKLYGIIILVKNSRRRRFSGLAYYNRNWIKIVLSAEVTDCEIAALIEHELYHCIGYNHKAIGRFITRGNIDYWKNKV